MIALLGTFSDGKPGTTIERDELQAAFIARRASSPVLKGISEAVDGAASKTAGTLARELAGMNKDQLIDTLRGNIRILNLNVGEEDGEAEPLPAGMNSPSAMNDTAADATLAD